MSASSSHRGRAADKRPDRASALSPRACYVRRVRLLSQALVLAVLAGGCHWILAFETTETADGRASDGPREAGPGNDRAPVHPELGRPPDRGRDARRKWDATVSACAAGCTCTCYPTARFPACTASCKSGANTVSVTCTQWGGQFTCSCQLGSTCNHPGVVTGVSSICEACSLYYTKACTCK